MKELEEFENSEQITPRAQENKVLEEILKLRNLHIFDIPADGNWCVIVESAFPSTNLYLSFFFQPLCCCCRPNEKKRRFLFS